MFAFHSRTGGTTSLGSKKQPSVKTVYGTIQHALIQLYKTKLEFDYAGRTDAGVHASNQCLNFFTDQYIPEQGLFKALNSLLNPSIQIKVVDYVLNTFHSRYHAYSREYRYRFSSSLVPIALSDFIYHSPVTVKKTDFDDFKNILLGTHDFSAFKCSGSLDNNPVKTLFYLNLEINEILDLVNFTPYRYYEVVIVKIVSFIRW